MSPSNHNSTLTYGDPNQDRIKILIVDRQNLSSELLKSQLKSEPNIKVIGSVHTEIATFKVIKNYLPNIVIIDFDVPEINGLALVKKISDNFREIKTLVFSHKNNFGNINRALTVGANGFLIKNSSAQDVKTVIESIIFDRSEDTKLQIPLPIDPLELAETTPYRRDPDDDDYESIEEVRQYLDRVTKGDRIKDSSSAIVNVPTQKKTTQIQAPQKKEAIATAEPENKAIAPQNSAIVTATPPKSSLAEVVEEREEKKEAIATAEPENKAIAPQNSAIVTATPPKSSLAEVVEEREDWSAATKDLMDALPRVWTRGLLYFLVIGTGIILPWSVLTKVDQTGSARGKLEPRNRVIQLDAPVGAKIKEINVKEGEEVKKGAILAELGAEIVSSELEQLKDKRSGLMQRLSQLELRQDRAKASIDIINQENSSRSRENDSQLAQAQQNLDTLKALYESQKSEKFAQIEQVKQEINSSIAARKQAELALKGSQERAKRLEAAFKEGVITQDRFLEIQQQAEENQERLNQANSAVELARSRLKEQESSYENLIKNSDSEIKQAKLRVEERRNNNQAGVSSAQRSLIQAEEELQSVKSEIVAVKTELAQTNKQIESSQFQLKQRQILAPDDGTVFNIAARGEGSVIQPGETVIEIAPQGSELILKAQIPPTDSGFLEKGMPVKVKFDAYPFQDYGVSEGQLISISPDSKAIETPQGIQEVYELKIELDRPYILDGEKKITLTPGQTATAEVIIRQRRVIDFFLDPFRKLQEDGVKL